MSTKELRSALKDVVTRKGLSVRIPEMLEIELDDLVKFVETYSSQKALEARIDELFPLVIGEVGKFHGQKYSIMRNNLTKDERIAALKQESEE